MDITLIKEWLNQISENLPVLIVSSLFLGSIFVVGYKIISAQNKMIVDYIKQTEKRQEEEKEYREEFRKDVYKQLDKTLDIYQDVKSALPAIESFTNKYPKIESVINSLEQNKHSYYDFMESIISRSKYSFKANYKNGSEINTSRKIIQKSYEHILKTISEEEDLFHKEYHMAFADFMVEEMNVLTDQLQKLSDTSIRLSVIESFFTNMRNILYHFRIALKDKYSKMKQENVKKELKEKFEGFELNKLEDKLKKISDRTKNLKEIKETENIFGF